MPIPFFDVASFAQPPNFRANQTNPIVRFATHALPLACPELDVERHRMGIASIAPPGSMPISLLTGTAALFAQPPSFRQTRTGPAAQHAKKASSRILPANQIARPRLRGTTLAGVPTAIAPTRYHARKPVPIAIAQTVARSAAPTVSWSFGTIFGTTDFKLTLKME